MIQYTKSSVRIAEMHFDELPEASLATDVIRYQWRFEKVPGTLSFPCQTRFLDLEEDPDKLLGGMKASTRSQVRRGYKESIAVDFAANPTVAMAEEFYTFYDEFAQAKHLPPANRARLGSMRSTGHLVLSSVRNAEGRALVWHCYLRHRGWARQVHSVSVYRLNPDKDEDRLVSVSNRHLQWRDMLALREAGVATYDFGGWYGGSDDTAKLRINEFKESFGGRVVDLHNTYDGVTAKGVLAVHLHKWRGGE